MSVEKTTGPTLYLPTPMTPSKRIGALKHGGRRHGLGHGSYLSDLVALQKTILLCGACQHRFDWRRHGYRSIWRYEHTAVQGQCDACRVTCTVDGRAFIHENHFSQVWMTRDVERQRRRFAASL